MIGKGSEIPTIKKNQRTRIYTTALPRPPSLDITSRSSDFFLTRAEVGSPSVHFCSVKVKCVGQKRVLLHRLVRSFNSHERRAGHVPTKTVKMVCDLLDCSFI